jgi:hypothetical protein
MFQFSEKLIDETIKVFKEEDDLDISKETANEFLDQLSDLFLALAGEKTEN